MFGYTYVFHPQLDDARVLMVVLLVLEDGQAFPQRGLEQALRIVLGVLLIPANEVVPQVQRVGPVVIDDCCFPFPVHRPKLTVKLFRRLPSKFVHLLFSLLEGYNVDAVADIMCVHRL